MMKGFDPEFVDTADFSRKITHRIWAERGVDRIRDYYAEDVIFRTPLTGIARGNEAVVANTLGVMHEFPDRRIFDEDFIWAEEESGVFYNSHRLLSKMTQTGSGMFGPATGRPVTTYTIADIMYRRKPGLQRVPRARPRRRGGAARAGSARRRRADGRGGSRRREDTAGRRRPRGRMGGGLGLRAADGQGGDLRRGDGGDLGTDGASPHPRPVS